MATSMIGIKPLHERILVGIYDDGETYLMLGGKKFWLLGDDTDRLGRSVEQKHPGIRPRWGVVLAVPDVVQETGDVKVGQKVLLDELKWSRGVTARLHGEDTKVWSIPFEDVMGLYDGEFTEKEIEQIEKLYPNWQSWEAAEI